MSNFDFDIGTLRNFQPPKYLCERCKALLYEVTPDWKKEFVSCPICKVKYVASDKYPAYAVDRYLSDRGYALTFEDPIRHGQQLAAIAHNFNKEATNYPPMRALFEALNSARKFIHFTSFGLSHIIFGALKLKAQTIPVRGIASNIYSDFIKEIEACRYEASDLEIQAFIRGQRGHSIPHQKLIVIDGLMAFKGAANMTNDGWRKAAKGRDYVEVVTNIQEVVKLHNKLFSPIWADLSDVQQIEMPSMEGF
jgi:phosphatidylserine/phosphatidylglycerophosphate/cardiolipin synthase-like enzyme